MFWSLVVCGVLLVVRATISKNPKFLIKLRQHTALNTGFAFCRGNPWKDKGGGGVDKNRTSYQGLVWIPFVEMYYNTDGLTDLQLKWIERECKIPIEIPHPRCTYKYFP